MELSDQQIDRYARHILLPDIGGVGQKALLGATASVHVKEGAFDGVCLSYLAAAGVGTLRLRGNLQAKVTHRDAAQSLLLQPVDIGKKRIDVLTRRLLALNPDVTIEVSPAGKAVDIICRSTEDLMDAFASGARAAIGFIYKVVRAANC